MLIILILMAIGIFILTGIIAKKLEAKRFNNGICPNCGKKLRYFDVDSQGGRGYTCDNCQYTTWVSYHNVDKKFIQ